MKQFAAVLIACAALFGLTACGDDRPCVKGHHETQIEPISYVTIGGVLTPIYGPVDVFVCDQYAPKDDS